MSFWEGRNVFVTGATGLLGGHVLRELLDAGKQVRALLRPDSPDRERKRAWLEEQGAEVIDGDLRSTQELRAACRDVQGDETVGVNIKPFMRQGANRIVFRLIVESAAGFTADFQLLNSCCGNWEETWERTCPE